MAAGFAALLHTGALRRAAPPPVYAACRVGWPGCAGGDLTRTSNLRVAHKVDGTDTNVSPDNSETLTIKAAYSPWPGPCNDTIYQATVTVQVTATGWSVSCIGCAAAPFRGIGICDDGQCTNSPENSYQYILKVDLDSFDVATNKNLRLVTYDTTSVDDGDTVADCSRVDAVSPTSQSFSASDTTFPCSYDCTTSVDTTMTITYE